MLEKPKPYGLAQRIKSYLAFWLEAKTWHSVHSPYIFSLIKHIYDEPFDWAVYRDIESLRSRLKRNKTLLTFPDYGDDGNEKQRKISQIVRRSSKSRVHCKVLSQFVSYVNPSVGLELGTSLGISYAYMVRTAPNATFVTIEGSPQIAEVASNNLSELGLFGNIKVGQFDDVLPSLLEELETVDFVYVDGNHQEDATWNYFNQIVNHVSRAGCIVFDDIYWSDGMQQAWQRICRDPRINLSVDFYHFGVVFTRPGVAKQHFKLRI